MTAPRPEGGSTPRIAGFAAVLFAAAAMLTAKTAWDLLPRARSFPSWFVPLFIAGVAGLAAVAGLFTYGVWRRRGSARPSGGPLAATVWVLLAASFVCTSSVHQFYPFRPSVLAALRGISPVLGFNVVLTGLAFVAAAVLGLVYRAGRREAALAGLLALGFLVLMPNDDCPNPFNETWLAAVGASPLMFLPNVYAVLFALATLLGVRPRLGVLALAGTCAAVTLLGLGHMTRVIW